VNRVEEHVLLPARLLLAERNRRHGALYRIPHSGRVCLIPTLEIPFEIFSTSAHLPELKETFSPLARTKIRWLNAEYQQRLATFLLTLCLLQSSSQWQARRGSGTASTGRSDGEAPQRSLFEPGRLTASQWLSKFCWAFAWQLRIRASPKTCKICFQHAANKSNK
jgi:hypothetical protein